MSGGGKGGGGKGGSDAYKPKHTADLENRLYGIASNAQPNQQMIGDYRSMMGNVRSGQTLTGQKIPTYNPGSAYKFNTPNISYAPQKAYQTALNQGLAGIQQDQARAMAQAQRSVASRGWGQGGNMRSANTTLARAALGQGSNLRSQYGLEQVKDQLDLDKFSAGQDLQRQGMQSAENLSRAGQSLQAQQTLQNILNQQIGTVGTLYNQIGQEEMKPYQMMSDLYGKNLQGEQIAAQASQGGKGDPFSALLNAGGQAALAYGTKGAAPAAGALFPKAAQTARGIFSSVLG